MTHSSRLHIVSLLLASTLHTAPVVHIGYEIIPRYQMCHEIAMQPETTTQKEGHGHSWRDDSTWQLACTPQS